MVPFLAFSFALFLPVISAIVSYSCIGFGRRAMVFLWFSLSQLSIGQNSRFSYWFQPTSPKRTEGILSPWDYCSLLYSVWLLEREQAFGFVHRLWFLLCPFTTKISHPIFLLAIEPGHQQNLKTLPHLEQKKHKAQKTGDWGNASAKPKKPNIQNKVSKRAKRNAIERWGSTSCTSVTGKLA